jgi:transcriptional regulator GlxA family with amidase domain
MTSRLDLIAEWIRSETGSGEARSREILEKLHELAKLYGGRAATRQTEDPRVVRSMAALEKAIAERWTVERLAAVAGMSRAQFARRFKAAFGVSPVDHLIRRRMERARELLERTDDSLQEIAAVVGYESEFAFNRAFRRHHGTPPGVFRRLRQTRTATSAVSLRLAA